MFPRQFNNIKLYAPDPYDLILSKLERNAGYDRDDADYLFKNLGKEEYHNSTLKLWIEIFESDQNPQ
jgi:hypothetical protein